MTRSLDCKLYKAGKRRAERTGGDKKGIEQRKDCHDDSNQTVSYKTLSPSQWESKKRNGRKRGEKTRVAGIQKRGKSQRKLIKAAGISLIFTITVTFTSCCCRPGNGGRRSEAPGVPHHGAAYLLAQDIM